MATVFLGLGSNINAEQNLRLAVRELRRRFKVLELSPVYRSSPVGFEGPDFLNLVAMVETDRVPASVNAVIDEIHNLAERERGDDRYSSRPLDVDLLLVDQLCLAEGPMELPRKDVLQYGFVLRPLADIAPDLVHPKTGRTIGEHWQEFEVDRHPLTITDVIL